MYTLSLAPVAVERGDTCRPIVKGVGGVRDSDMALTSKHRVATEPSATVTLCWKLTVASSGGGTVGKSITITIT